MALEVSTLRPFLLGEQAPWVLAVQELNLLTEEAEVVVSVFYFNIYLLKAFLQGIMVVEVVHIPVEVEVQATL